MKTPYQPFLFTMLAAIAGLFSCKQNNQPQPDPIFNPDLYGYLMDQHAPYDSVLAKKAGADQYGMKQYVMAFLKEGPMRHSMDSVTAANLQKAHLRNIMRMAKEGKLIVAGPFMDEGEVAGIYIFNVTSIEEARALTATDPAIQAGRLTMELRPWYGSAALQMTTVLHKRLEKKRVAE
jgi:uncharacterized protein YciI